MITKQKGIMLVFPLLDTFWCIYSSSETCSTYSKESLSGHHCFYLPSTSLEGKEVVNSFQRFGRRIFEEIILEGSLMEKGDQILEVVFRVFRDSNNKFYITTLIWLTIDKQIERCFITRYFSLIFLAYFWFY